MRIRFNPSKKAVLAYIEGRIEEQENVAREAEENPPVDDTGKPDTHLANIYKDNAKRYIQLLKDQRFIIESHNREDVLMEMEVS
jgi:hypothetical protein